MILSPLTVACLATGGRSWLKSSTAMLLADLPSPIKPFNLAPKAVDHALDGRFVVSTVAV